MVHLFEHCLINHVPVLFKYAQSPLDGKFSGVACDTIAVRMTPDKRALIGVIATIILILALIAYVLFSILGDSPGKRHSSSRSAAPPRSPGSST